MAVKASAQITLTYIIDVKAYYRYYLLQSSTAATPSKPDTYPPSSSWDDTEPTYTEGSTNSLYFVDCTIFNDDTWKYSEVSLSSAYESAKLAYNLAHEANGKADNLETDLDTNKESFSNSMSGLDDRLSAAETLMGTMADGMVTFVYDDANNSFTLQSPNGETFAVTETNNNIKAINDKIASIIQNADDTTLFTKQIEALVKEHGIALNYVHEGTYEDETGNKRPCLLLGETDTIFKLRITNKAIEFIEDYGSDANGLPIVEIPAYITNDGEKSKMMIENAEVTEEFKQGGFVWVTHGNGNLGLTWKGGTS